MAFNENGKLNTLRQRMIDACNQGTSWDAFKAEFAAMSQDFKDEVVDLFDAEVDRGNTKVTEWQDYTDNVIALKEEIENL